MQEVIIVFSVCLLLVHLVKKIEMRNYSDRERFRPLWFKCAIKDHLDENKTHYARRVLVRAVEADDPDWIDFYRTGSFFFGYTYHAQFGRNHTKEEHEFMKMDSFGRKAGPQFVNVEFKTIGFCWPCFAEAKAAGRGWWRFARPKTKWESNTPCCISKRLCTL